MRSQEVCSYLTVISGMPAGESGTGRLVSSLLSKLGSGTATVKINWVIKPEKTLPQKHPGDMPETFLLKYFSNLKYRIALALFWLKVVLILEKGNKRILIIHPQSLGYDLTLRLMSTRGVLSYLYLLDSSYFCPVSYNHIKGEHSPCLRCLGGDFSQAQVNGCKPFPRSDVHAHLYAPRLYQLVADGKVIPIAQTKTQAEQAQKHFRLDHPPDVIGLWASDWEQSFEYFYRKANAMESSSYEWDVLFHANCLRAKGFLWMIAVAKNFPKLNFVFPFHRPNWVEAPPNCSFIPCTWDTGLREHMVKSKFVAVPSIWSAPIESALVKSIAMARAVIVVKNQKSYIRELPENLVLKLAEEPMKASYELADAINKGWTPDHSTRTHWLKQFVGENEDFTDRLIHSVIKYY